MMCGHPLSSCQVELEHGEIDDPDGVEGGCAIDRGSTLHAGFLNGSLGDNESAVPLGIFLGKLSAKVAGGGVNVDFALGEAAFELGVAGFDGVGWVCLLYTSRCV